MPTTAMISIRRIGSAAHARVTTPASRSPVSGGLLLLGAVRCGSPGGLAARPFVESACDAPDRRSGGHFAASGAGPALGLAVRLVITSQYERSATTAAAHDDSESGFIDSVRGSAV